jgi:hypothetical protein
VRQGEDAEPVRGVTYDPHTGSGTVNPTLVWRVRLSFAGAESTMGRYATSSEANAAMKVFRDAMDTQVVVCHRSERSRCPGCLGLRWRFAEDLGE